MQEYTLNSQTKTQPISAVFSYISFAHVSSTFYSFNSGYLKQSVRYLSFIYKGNNKIEISYSNQ